MKLLYVFLLLISINVPAQNFNWATSGGLVGNSTSSDPVFGIVKDSQGNIYQITGSSQSQHCQGVTANPIGGQTTFIYKFNAGGALQYIKRIGTSFRPLNLTVDNDDNLYVLGNLYGTYDLQFEDQSLTGGQPYRSFLFKIDAEGELVWHVKIEESGSYGACPLLLYANEYLYVQSSYTGISQLDLNGESLAYLAPDSFANYNAQDQFFITDAAVQPNGNLVFYGCAYATITYGTTILEPVIATGNVPNVLLETTADLSLNWARMYNGLGSSGRTLEIDPDGNIYLGVRVNQSFSAGSDTVANPAPGSTDYTDALLKLATSGEPLWIKGLNNLAHVNAMVMDADGSGLVFGGFLGGSLSVGDINLDYNNGRAYIGKITTAGEIENAFNFSAGSFGGTGQLISGTDGRFYASGLLVGGASAEFGCTETTDTDGFYLAEFTLDPINAPVPTIVQAGNILTAEPSFNGAIQWFFNGEAIEGANTQTLESLGSGSYSVTYAYELGCETQTSDPLLSATESVLTEVKVYPNPSTGTFHLGPTATAYAFTVSDINGRLVASGQTDDSQSIDLSRIQNGVYILQLSSETTFVSKKLIKQSH